MSRARRDWETLAKLHAEKLGAEVKMTGVGVGKYERVEVTCPHGTHSVLVCRFVQKQFCCRSEARKHQTGRENVGEKISAALLSSPREIPFEERLARAERNRQRVGTAEPDRDDLLYIAEREGKVKVGRVAANRTRWFDELGLTVVEAWEMKQIHSGRLERLIHEKFGHLRPLDPSFGKGWTEVFDVSPHEIITFIEGVL
jgi:hypothetical protein